MCRALVHDWEDLADILDVPIADRKKFTPGRKPQDTWDFIEARGRLSELRPALEMMGRKDLVDLLDSDAD